MSESRSILKRHERALSRLVAVAFPTAATIFAALVTEALAKRRGLTVLSGWSLAHGSFLLLVAYLAVVTALSTFWLGRLLTGALLCVGAVAVSRSNLSLAAALGAMASLYILWAITRLIEPAPGVIEQADAADDIRNG